MKNIWTQHLERSNTEDRNKETTFTKMLHSLVKTATDDSEGTRLFISGDITSDDLSYSVEEKLNVDSTNEDRMLLNNEYINAPYAAETEITVWAAKSQKGHELGINSFDNDHVRLMMAESGQLILRYDVAGESPFEMNVKSEEEAMQIIDEDNTTTEQLYPDNSELKWMKISTL
jgi:hypothetical protein